MHESIHRIRIAALGTAVIVMVGLLWPTAGLAATGKEMYKCHKTMLNQARVYAKVTWSKLLNCTQQVGDCQLAEEIDGLAATECVANVSVKKCDPLVTQLSDQEANRELKTVLKCGLLTLAELEQFVGGLGYSGVVAACGATDVNTLVSCVFDDVRCNAERQLFIADPRAQASLVAVGLDASFPCVAP